MGLYVVKLDKNCMRGYVQNEIIRQMGVKISILKVPHLISRPVSS
jgi:hypothetical protein